MVFPILSFLVALLTLLFGILVLIFPKFLRYAVGIYFVIFGILTILKIFFSALIAL